MQMINHVDVKRTGKFYLDEKGVEQMNKEKQYYSTNFWMPFPLVTKHFLAKID